MSDKDIAYLNLCSFEVVFTDNPHVCLVVRGGSIYFLSALADGQFSVVEFYGDFHYVGTLRDCCYSIPWLRSYSKG